MLARRSRRWPVRLRVRTVQGWYAMNLSDEEIEQLAEAAFTAFYTHDGRQEITWQMSAQANWIAATKAILAALPSRPSDSALRAEVRKVVEEIEKRIADDGGSVGRRLVAEWSYRLYRALEATEPA